MKLCIECKHYAPGARCHAPQAGTVTNPVTGEQRAWFCEVQRAPDHPKFCGPDGRFFEPLPPVNAAHQTALEAA